MKRSRLLIAACVLVAALITAASARVDAQRGRAGGPPPTAKATAPFDPTGYWVPVVNEDWRYRMVTPPKGDYRGVPITNEALKIVNAWDPAADEAAGNQCKSYGAAVIMRVPGRIHITWQDEATLRLDTDAGIQTRLFRFAAAPSDAGARTWQGNSAARWDRRSLTVVTTNMRAGYLRKNGVPYGENAKVTEYIDVSPYPNDGQLLVVTTLVDDPQYLTQPFIVSSHFKKEADGSKWDPKPCSSTW